MESLPDVDSDLLVEVNLKPFYMSWVAQLLTVSPDRPKKLLQRKKDQRLEVKASGAG